MYNDSLYRVSLKCLITNSQSEILVIKEMGRGSYDLPGGGIDHGETIQSAIARELDEEINFKGDFTYDIIGVDDPAKLLTRDVWQCKLLFRVSLGSAEFGVGREADEVRFINPEALRDSNSTPEQKIYEYIKNYI